MKRELDSQVAALLREIFGQGTRAVGFEYQKNETDYQVMSARLENPGLAVTIKLAGPGAVLPCPFERTAVLLHLVGERTDIPMPVVYAADTSCSRWPWRYMVREYIEGVEWSALRRRASREERGQVFRALGRAAGQLHAIEFPAFGEIGPGGQVEGMLGLVEALEQRVEMFIPDPELRDFFLGVLHSRSADFEGVEQAGLTHEDLHAYNLLFKQTSGQWQVATILDFDKAWAGHGESDLARLDLWRGMMAPEFWEGYQQFMEVSAGYVRRRAVYQLLWCLEFARPTDVHWKDTQGVCRELGVEMPKRFG